MSVRVMLMLYVVGWSQLVVKLKTDVLTLEGQVDSLKADLTEVRRSQSLGSADRDSLAAAFDGTEITSPIAADGPNVCHSDPRCSFSYVYKRNKTRDWVPIPGVENTAADDETNVRTDGASRSVFKSPERCHHPCSIATGKGKPEDHSVHVHAVNGPPSGIATSCNGETSTETSGRLSDDVLNDTLSDLVESNSSDTSGQVVDVKVTTTVRCKKRAETSDASRRSDGDASETLKLSRAGASCSTQTDSAEQCNGRYVITHHVFVTVQFPASIHDTYEVLSSDLSVNATFFLYYRDIIDYFA